MALCAGYAIHRRRGRRLMDRQRLRHNDRIKADWEAMLQRQRHED
jgi:hypothetical protein